MSDIFRLAAKYLDKAAQITDQHIQTLSENAISRPKEEIRIKKEKTKVPEFETERKKIKVEEEAKEVFKVQDKAKEKEKEEKKKKESKKEKSEQKSKKKEKKAPRKKTGYQWYFEESMIKIKSGSEGKSKGYLEIMVPELSTIISKDWKAMGVTEQEVWNDKAEEINIITQGLGELPQKTARISSSPSISDTESDNEMPTKKIKTT